MDSVDKYNDSCGDDARWAMFSPATRSRSPKVQGRRHLMRVTIPAIFALAACGGGGSALEGIYTVDAWTSNPTSCADPGPSTIATHEPMVYAKKKSLFGQSFLAVDDCTDPADCSTGAAEQGIGYFFFDHGNDDDGWVGTIVFESGPDLD